jgi:hypothetical protein
VDQCGVRRVRQIAFEECRKNSSKLGLLTSGLDEQDEDLHGSLGRINLHQFHCGLLSCPDTDFCGGCEGPSSWSKLGE